MLDRRSDSFAFLVILAVCLAGAFKAPWWAVVAGATGLVLLSLAERWRAASGADVADTVQLAASSLNGTAIAVAAFFSGHGLAWMWGV
jgi:hypothetical protein